MKVIAAAKKHAISRGHLGCLGDVATVNLLRGCAGACAFCYARALPGVPPPGTLSAYGELPRMLRTEIERRKQPPSFVLFSTASDPFIGGDEVLALTRACLTVLVQHEVGVSFSTRGDMPDDVIELLARHGPHVRVTVPLVSMSDSYHERWEPGTIRARRRLFLIQRLRQAGLEAQVRIEPLIPFVNDHTEQLRELVSALVGIGLSQAVTSFIHLRPGVAEQLQREAPTDVAPLVLGAFALPVDRPLHEQQIKFRHLPIKQRLAGLRRVQRIGRDRGLRISACHCQNPGIPARRCPVQPPELPEPQGTQLSLL